MIDPLPDLTSRFSHEDLQGFRPLVEDPVVPLAPYSPQSLCPYCIACLPPNHVHPSTLLSTDAHAILHLSFVGHCWMMSIETASIVMYMHIPRIGVHLSRSLYHRTIHIPVLLRNLCISGSPLVRSLFCNRTQRKTFFFHFSSSYLFSYI